MAKAEIAAWRPFREMERWARSFPHLFEEWPRLERENIPAMESFLKNGNMVVRVDTPGVDPKDIDISVAGNVLRIRGERKEEKEVKSEDYIRHEASYGSFERSMTLPEGANTDKIAANFKNGVVEVTVPVAKAVEGKKIPLQVESGDGKK